MIFDYRNTKESLINFKGHNSICSDISFHPLENNILTSGGGEDSMLYFWDISNISNENKPKLLDKKNQNAPIFSIDYIENHLAVGGLNGKLDVYSNISFKK